MDINEIPAGRRPSVGKKILNIWIILIILGAAVWLYKNQKKEIQLTPANSNQNQQQNATSSPPDFLGINGIKSKARNAAGQLEQIEMTLNIDTGANRYSYVEKISPDATVLDLLKQASQKEGFALETKDSSIGVYVEAIAGVKNDAKSNKYWLFSVNGQSSNVGASTYKLMRGDVVEWKYNNL